MERFEREGGRDRTAPGKAADAVSLAGQGPVAFTVSGFDDAPPGTVERRLSVAAQSDRWLDRLRLRSGIRFGNDRHRDLRRAPQLHDAFRKRVAAIEDR